MTKRVPLDPRDEGTLRLLEWLVRIYKMVSWIIPPNTVEGRIIRRTREKFLAIRDEYTTEVP